MAVTLRNLWRFLGAAGAGGVSSGARRMGLAQATVSASIRDLEEAAGARLFEPTPLGARLTSTGVGLRDHAVGLALDVEQGLSDLHAGRVGPGRAQALVLAGAPAGSWLDWAAISGALAHARRGGDRATRLALAADAPVPADGIRVGWRVLPAGEAGPPGAWQQNPGTFSLFLALSLALRSLLERGGALARARRAGRRTNTQNYKLKPPKEWTTSVPDLASAS